VSKESRRAARNAARTGSTGSGSTGPSGSPRAGRRERVRHVEQKSFLDRYRGLLIGLAVALVAAGVVGITIVQSTQAAFTCTIVWDPSPTPSPAAGSSARLGFAQDDMGALHSVSRPQRYTFCPPASGNHYNQVGLGPITPHVYKPDDNVGPMNWIHNLEHGAVVVLYRSDSDGATADGIARFQAFFDAFPPSPLCQVPPGRLSPVIAKFDQMKWPFAALVWHRVLPMETWDPALVLQFYATESERRDADGAFVAPPEPQPDCAAHTFTPSAGPSAEPSGSTAPSESAAPATSESPAASGSPAPSPSPSASPS
jgi:Protein of unknown function (DUF3105)